MKKIIFMIRELGIGGIETSFLNLINELKLLEYDITVVLKKEKKSDKKILQNVKIINLNINEYDKNLFEKIWKKIKLAYYKVKLKNKYDFSGCYTDYCCELSKLSRIASKNNAIWMHSNYLTLFNNNVNKINDFFSRIHIDKFKNIICVSEDAKISINHIFPNNNFSIKVINNLFNLSFNFKDIPSDYKKDKFTFINVSRHDESCKKISRIIEASKLLKKDKFDFCVLFIGDGDDTKKYLSMAKNANCRKNLIFLGAKQNSLPYYNVSDALIISSDSEGGPVVLLEALSARVPVISTDVGYVSKFLNKNNGIIIEKNVESLYSAMKEMIQNKNNYNNKFNCKQHNKKEIKKLINLF